MKRSMGHHSRNSGKRYDKDRNSQHMHPQQQYLNQNQHQHQQHQRHNSPVSSNQYYGGGGGSSHGMGGGGGSSHGMGGGGGSSHGMGGMGMYGRSNNVSQSPYMYNNSSGASHMSQRMWNYNVPPPMPVRPPLPRGPAPQMNPVLPPPPPQPTDSEHAISSSVGKKVPQSNAGESDDSHTLVSMKPKRKSMSSRYGCPKGWVREDAIKAIALEEEFTRRNAKAPILLLRFPDPDLNRTIISGYCDEIESVHFQQNSAPRYCFVHLKEGADVEAAITTISKVPFGTGFVSAELKRIPSSVTSPSKPDEVDPYTLYIGNLPTTISSDTVKEHFPGAHRIDIGFAQRMKYTRYAFVRYDSVEKAMEAFKRSVNTLIESRSLIVRFRRQRSTVASGEPISKKDAAAAGEANNKNKDDFDGRDRPTNQVKSSSTSSRNDLDNETDEPLSSKANPFSNLFESPSVFDEPEMDSKDHVFEESERLRRQLQIRQLATRNLKTGQRRNTLQDMFAELERRDMALASIGEPMFIKQEPEAAPSDEEPMEHHPPEPEPEPRRVNLLGLRYIDDGTIKPEPNDDDDDEYGPRNGDVDGGDMNSDRERLAANLTQADVPDFFDPPEPPIFAVASTSSTDCPATDPITSTSGSGSSAAPDADKVVSSSTSAGRCASTTIPGQAPKSIPTSTAVSSTAVAPGDQANNEADGGAPTPGASQANKSTAGEIGSKTTAPVPVAARSSMFPSTPKYLRPRRVIDMTPEGIRRRELSLRDEKPDLEELKTKAIMRKIHHEVRNSTENVRRKRPRDDLDDLFAQMNSDDDMDDFF